MLVIPALQRLKQLKTQVPGQPGLQRETMFLKKEKSQVSWSQAYNTISWKVCRGRDQEFQISLSYKPYPV